MSPEITSPSAHVPVARPALVTRAGLRAALIVAAALLLVGGVWMAHLLQVTRTPPHDNLEQLLWVQSLQWGYYKHPPLPTWLIWPFVAVFGDGDAVAAMLGAGLTLGSLGLSWLLWRRMGLGPVATIGLLATLCNSYYSARLDVYNHNVVLLPFVAAAAWACWVAFRRRSLGAWAALGLVMGLGLLVKYQMVLVGASVLAVWVQQRGWRLEAHRRGPALALLLATLVVLPHVVWLVQHDFPPFSYAVSSSLGAGLEARDRGLHATVWLSDQLLNRALPGLLMLTLLLLWLWRRGARAAAWTGAAPTAPSDLARAILLSWGLLPLMLMVGIGLASGATLQKHWGHGFMAFTMPALMLLGRNVAWRSLPWPTVGVAFVTVQLLALSHHAWTYEGGSRADGRARHAWRQQNLKPLAAAIDAAARSRLGEGVAVVRGPQALATAVARALPGRPWVRVDGPLAWSPWLGSDEARGCATVWVAAEPLPQDRVLARGRLDGVAWALVAARHPELGCVRPARSASQAGGVGAPAAALGSARM